jgi:hypothetical protein
MAVVINGDYGMTTPTGVFTDSSGNVGIGCTPEATYQLEVRNPDTAASAKTYMRLKSNAASGDGDAVIIMDSADTGEAGLLLMSNGVPVSYMQTINGGDYVAITNELSGADLTMYGANVASNDAYSLRYLRGSGVAPVTGVTGTITASATSTTITGLSTTTGLVRGMLLTRTAGTGAFATGTYITAIDTVASSVTIQSGVGSMTAGSITFTGTPTPVTISAYNSNASSAWAVDQDFARFAFCNGDTSSAGDGGIKASINAYVYDVAGTGAGLDFYVSSDGTTLTKAVRLDENANMKFNSGYGSVATAYGCRAWVSFNGTGTVAIRASGNVSSITDGGVGTYTVNFSTAMPDANYAVSGFANFNASTSPAGILTYGNNYVPTAGALPVKVANSTSGVAVDVPYVNVLVTR